MVYVVDKTIGGECNQIHQQVVFNLSDKSSSDPTSQSFVYFDYLIKSTVLFSPFLDDAQSPNQLQTERKSSTSLPPVKP